MASSPKEMPSPVLQTQSSIHEKALCAHQLDEEKGLIEKGLIGYGTIEYPEIQVSEVEEKETKLWTFVHEPVFVDISTAFGKASVIVSAFASISIAVVLVLLGGSFGGLFSITVGYGRLDTRS